jgi:hypothetical protein
MVRGFLMIHFAYKISSRLVCITIISLQILVSAASMLAQQVNNDHPLVKPTAVTFTAVLPHNQSTNDQHALARFAQDREPASNPQNPLFLPAVTYGSGGAAAGSVVVADVNRDGKPDLIVTNLVPTSNGSVGVLLGNGDGTFQPVVLYDSGGYESGWVSVADVNADGIPDVIVANMCTSLANCAAGSVGVMLGKGDGTFKGVVTYATEPTSGIAVADLNHDGKPDIVVSHCNLSPCVTNNAQGIVEVLLGNGNGTFQSPVDYSGCGNTANGVTIADVNQDNVPDLVVGTCGVSIFLGKGDGTFTFDTEYIVPIVGVIPANPVVADVNDDGVPDIVVANGQNVSVLLGKGAGLFGSTLSYPIDGLTGISAAVADVNGDGKPDLVVSGIDNGGAAALGTAVFLGNGDGTFQTAVIYGSGGTVERGFSPSAVAIADLNNDGKFDIVAANQVFEAEGAVGVLLNNRQGPPYASTTTKLVSSPNPTARNVGATYTATVTNQAGGAATGSITFMESDLCCGRVLGIVPLSGNSAAFGVPYRKVGWYYVTASYSGDAANNFSNSSTVAEFVGTLPVSTHVAVTTTESHSFFGQGVTFTAKASWTGGTVTDGEPIIFFDGTTQIASVKTAGGVASFTTSALSPGTHTISASYGGDSQFKPSKGAVTQIVGALPVTTKTVLHTSGSPSLVGQSVIFTATVTEPYSTIPDGEMVTFSTGSLVLGTSTTTGGIASITTSALTGTTHTIKATYGGDSTFRSSSGTIGQVVQKDSTSTTLASSVNPSVYGQVVTWTATVTGAGATPTGKVAFMWNSTSIGTGTLDVHGVASLMSSTLTAVQHPLTAIYRGDANYAGSTSVILNQTVQPAASTATITSSRNPSTQGQTVTFTATITSPTAKPTGPVTFTLGSTTLGTVQLAAGKAKFTTAALPPGANTVTVTYAGDSNISGSSAFIVETVQP